MYQDRKSTRLNSSHANISYAVFCLKKKIIILISAFIVFTQPLKADEDKINKIIEKLNTVVECINKEFEDIKEFQNTQFSNAKKQKAKELDLVKYKLSGFFSDFPTINQEDK